MKQIQDNLKIGIPNTLFSAYNLSYWRRFLTLSGMEAILSCESTKEMADLGGRLLPHEFCIPIKVFMGHVLNLLEKGVDHILLPRMTDHKKANFFCPKLIGLPEIVKYTLNLEEKRLFSPKVICNGLNIQVTEFPSIDSHSLHRMKMAEKQAREYGKKILANCRRLKITLPEATIGITPKRLENHLTIGLLGYAYSLYDPFISKGLQSKLDKLRVAIATWEMLEPELIEHALAGLKRPLFWNYGRMLLGAGLNFLKDPAVDGIIYVTTFGCGPDSVATEILNIEASNCQKPFLLINLDEHTEDGHLFTRLEAFIDMLMAQKEDKAV
jgi:predicted nucleotide-binding protein (sugar kinase/HSP70/actin superfamily)